MHDRIHTLAESIVGELALSAYAHAVEHVPVDTGALRSSLTHAHCGLSAVVSAAAPHAACVELGTSARPPQPYLLPALRDAQSRLSTIIGGLS